MGAMKAYAMDVSYALGFGGELNDRVIEVASSAMGEVNKLSEDKRHCEAPEFIDLVNRIDSEMMDDPD
jgi:hypothetical protein